MDALDFAPDFCRAEVRMASGATATLTLDWRDERQSLRLPAFQPPEICVKGRDGRAWLCLRTGQLTLQKMQHGRPTGETQTLVSGEGRDLIDDANGALVELLMRSQADGAVAMDVWDSSVALSFASVSACYRSWDESGGEAWEKVEQRS